MDSEDIVKWIIIIVVMLVVALVLSRLKISKSGIYGKGAGGIQQHPTTVDRNTLALFNNNMFNNAIPVDPGKDTIRLMTFNIHYQSPYIDRRRTIAANPGAIVGVIDKYKPTILGLQEVSSRPGSYKGSNLQTYLQEQYPYISKCEADNNLYNYVVSKIPFELIDTSKHNLDYERCATILKMNPPGQDPFVIVNTHFSVTGVTQRAENARNLLVLLQNPQIKDLPKIIMGDFNDYRVGDYTPTQQSDLEGIKSYRFAWKLDKGNVVTRQLEVDGWVDTFVKHNQNHGQDPPLIPVNTNQMAGRIDYIYMSPEWKMPLLGAYAHYFDSREPQPSDHIPIIADFQTPPKTGVETLNANAYQGKRKRYNIEIVLMQNATDPKDKTIVYEKSLVEETEKVLTGSGSSRQNYQTNLTKIFNNPNWRKVPHMSMIYISLPMDYDPTYEVETHMSNIHNIINESGIYGTPVEFEYAKNIEIFGNDRKFIVAHYKSPSGYLNQYDEILKRIVDVPDYSGAFCTFGCDLKPHISVGLTNPAKPEPTIGTAGTIAVDPFKTNVARMVYGWRIKDGRNIISEGTKSYIHSDITDMFDENIKIEDIPLNALTELNRLLSMTPKYHKILPSYIKFANHFTNAYQTKINDVKAQIAKLK